MRISFIIIVIIAALSVACNSSQEKKTETNISVLPDSLKIDSLSKLIIDKPREAELYAQRSQLYFEKGKVTKAINDLHIANTLDSLNPVYYIQLADFYLHIGKSEVVNRLLMKANHLNPDNKDILYRLGNLYFYIQDYKKSLAFLNHAKSVDPYFAEVYFTKALVLKELGDTGSAVVNLQIAVEREPNYYDAYMQLALLYAELPDPLAIDYYNNALSVIPNSYEALYGKAIYYQQYEHPEKAIDIYRQMLNELSEELPMVHYNLGYIEMAYFSNYKQAINHYDSALIYQPEYIDALANKAFCYEQVRQYTSARESYKKVLQLQPNYEVAVKGLNRLDKKQ